MKKKEKERLDKAIELYDGIKKLYPDSYMSLNLHGIDFTLLNPEELMENPRHLSFNTWELQMLC